VPTVNKKKATTTVVAIDKTVGEPAMKEFFWGKQFANNFGKTNSAQNDAA